MRRVLDVYKRSRGLCAFQILTSATWGPWETSRRQNAPAGTCQERPSLAGIVTFRSVSLADDGSELNEDKRESGTAASVEAGTS